MEYNPMQELPAFTAIPEFYLGILSELQAKFYGAMIAGGAIRDHILQKTVRDIDVFISTEQTDFTVEEVHDLLTPFRAESTNWVNFTECRSDLQNYNLNFNNVVQVWNGAWPTEDRQDWATVQIILLDAAFTLEELASRCDFGICQVSHDGSRLYLGPNFIWDVQHKKLTLRKCSDVKSHWRRWESNLRFKFKGYTLVAPEIVKFMEDEDEFRSAIDC